MKFLLDQDVYAGTARFLSGLGHDVAPVAKLGLSRANDSDLLRAARDQGRVFVTRDRDFEIIPDARPQPHAPRQRGEGKRLFVAPSARPARRGASALSETAICMEVSNETSDYLPWRR